MDSLVRTYIKTLFDLAEDDQGALSSVNLIYDLINSESNKIDLNLEILFAVTQTQGLMQYLKTLTRKQNTNSDLIKEIFNLLKCVVVDFKDNFKQYVGVLTEFCGTTILKSTSKEFKLMMYDVLILLIEKYNGYFQANLNWVDDFFQDLLLSKIEKISSSTEKKKAYLLLGKLIATFPELMNNKTQEKIFRLLQMNIRTQLEYGKRKSSSFRVTELEGLFECLQLFLEPFHKESYVKNCSRELYGFVKDGCAIETFRRTSVRAALKILENYFKLFAEDVYKDYSWWINFLVPYLSASNKMDKFAAYDLLNAFYPGIVKVMKKKENFTEYDTSALKFFIGTMKAGMAKNKGCEVGLAMENFGHFAKLCVKCGEAVSLEEMFTMVIQLAENCCLGQINEEIEIRYLAGLLVSMAEISKNLYKTGSSKDSFTILGNFSSFIIISYPKIPNRFQHLIINNLIKAVATITCISDTFLDSYLETLIFATLIKCCSYPFESDVEFIKELGNVENTGLISCNNYFPIWNAFCNIRNTLNKNDKILSRKTKIDVLRERDLPSKIFDKFMGAILQIIEKLDLSIIADDCDDQSLVSINTSGFKPKVGSDFYIFMNVVELFSVIVTDCELDVLQKWVPVLVTDFIKFSSSCPMKSGFYKLLTTIFQKTRSEFYYEDRLDVADMKSFLIETLLDVHKLEDTDLVSCLRMIMNVPVSTLKTICTHLTPFLQMVFTLGIDDLDLAKEGLNALQKWHDYLDPEDFKPLLKAMVPFLNPYFLSKKSAGDTESITKYDEYLLQSAFTKPKNEIYRKYRGVYNNQTNTELMNFQKQLLKFLSGIDIELCEPIYRPEKHNTSEFTEVLRFEVPFVDMNVKIFLDKLLSRVIELTRHNDTKTRIAACELLHSMTIIFLGNSQNFDELPESTKNLFKKLLPCIFKLGSDSNVVIKSMFHQLSYQMARYYASKYQYQSTITDLLLQVLFETVSQERDISLRHFSANLIREFVRSSINERTDDGSSSAHILAVVKRICILSVQPCDFKRLGAALALNSIYRELREKISLVNIYWLELLVYFVKSLALNSDSSCSNKETSIALDHIHRVLSELHDIFIEPSPYRRVPKCLPEGTLNATILWMFSYCSSENNYCRNKCMELIVHLLSKLPEYNSLDRYFEIMQVEKIDILNEYFKRVTLKAEISLEDIHHVDKSEIIKWVKSLLAGLHCFFWLLKEKAIDFGTVLSNDNRFWDSLIFFCEKILVVDEDTLQTTAADCVDFRVTFRTSVHEIFCLYLKIFSGSSTSLEMLIGGSSWQENFWNIFIMYFFVPLNFVNSNTVQGMFPILIKVLSQLTKLPAEKKEKIFSKIRLHQSHKIFDSFMQQLDTCHFVSLIEKQHINALITLQKSGAMDDIFPSSEERNKKMITKLFNFVKENESTKTCSLTVTLQLQSLVAFSLENLEINFVLELLTNPLQRHLKDKSGSTVAHGHYFFTTFKQPITEYLYQHQADMVLNYLAPSAVTKEKLEIVIDCLKFASESKKILVFSDLLNGIFQNWHGLVSWSSASDCTEYLFYLIDAIVSRDKELKNLDSNNMSSVFLWLMSRLLNANDSVSRKKDILKLLAPFISNIDEDGNKLLRNKLQDFQSKFLEESAAKEANSEYSNLYNALLTLFCYSENKVVFDIILSVGASDFDEIHHSNIQKVLENVMRKTSEENRLEFLTRSFSFIKTDKPPKMLLNCVQIFLIPLLYLSTTETLKSFFSSEVKYILDTMKIDILKCRDQISEENAILTKTAAVLVADVYSEVENRDIELAIPMEIRGASIKSEISKVIFGIIRNPVNLKSNLNEPILRKLRCFAYNTLIKMVRKSPKDADFYGNLFNETPARNLLVWRNIIDCNKEIKLKMIVDELPARKKALIKTRKELKSKALNTSLRSIPTQYLSTSSLVSEIKYDMSEWNISNNDCIVQFETKTYDVELETDAFNTHECMDTICELIVFLVESKICPLPNLEEDPNPELPRWMECMKQSLKNAVRAKQKNIIMFILKIINNCSNIFCPYAKGWLDLMVGCVIHLEEVNYLVADTIVIMLSWHDVAIPANKEMNNKLLSLLLDNISIDNTTTRNYQLELISSVINFWHKEIDVPYPRIIVHPKLTSMMLELRLKICKRFLLCNVLPFPKQNAMEFTENLILCLSRNTFTRSIKIFIFEVLALILRTANNKNLIPEICKDLEENVVKQLSSMKFDSTKTKTDFFYSCLDHTIIYFPKILQRFALYLLHNFTKYQGKIKAQCLKMLAIDIKQLPDDAFTQLMSMQFANCLRESNHEILKNSLTVLKLHVNVIKVIELETLLPDISRLSTHPSIECRQLIYDIVDAIYSRLLNDQSEEALGIKSQCKAILLDGLLDSDQILQEKMFESWKTRCQLREPVTERFLSIIKDMYSPQNEARFVNYAVDYLLDACSSTPFFKSNIFDNSLQNCDFQEQDFACLASIRRKNSSVPMFVNSMSNQLMEISLRTLNSGTMSLRLPGSQTNFVFQPTIDNQLPSSPALSFGESPSQMDGNASLRNYNKSQDAALRKLQNRLHSNQADASLYYASKNVEKRERRHELINTRSERLEKNIKLSRTYKNGWCPDIKIPRSAVVNPLKVLAKRDSIVAKHIFTCIFDGMLNEIPNKKNYLQSVSNCFNNILRCTLQNDSILIETLLETTFFHSSDIKLDTQTIVTSSHASGLPSLGSLIIENTLCTNIHSAPAVHVAKKLKVDDSEANNLWVQLAELYKALDKNSIVNGILKEKFVGSNNEHLKQGLEFEQTRKWEDAYKLYSKKIQETCENTKSFEKHFISEAYFKCAAKLSKWHKMNRVLETKYQNRFDDLWKENWHIEHTLPWFFISEAHECAQQGRPSQYLDTLKTWMNDEKKNTILTNLVAEPLAILLLLNQENNEARVRVNNCIESMIENWNCSTPSLEKFSKLQMLSEIDSMLHPYEISQDELPVNAVKQVLKFWKSSSPSNDNSIWWDRRTVYRQQVSAMYTNQLIDNKNDRSRARTCVNELKNFIIESNLPMVDIALQSDNLSLASYFLTFVDEKLEEYKMTGFDISSMKSQVDLNFSKYYLLLSIKSSQSKKEEYYKHCLDRLALCQDIKSDHGYLRHLGNTLCALLNETLTFLSNDFKNYVVNSMQNLLAKPEVDSDTLVQEMRESVLTTYGSAALSVKTSSPTQISATYLALAKYCQQMISDSNEVGSHEDDLTYKKHFIKSILRAIKHDSREAQLLFPTLLQLKDITCSELQSTFISESNAVEEWKFLIWIQQLLAHVDSDVLPAIEKLTLNIVEKYPNAVQFSFLSSDLETVNCKRDDAQRLNERLRQMLNRTSSISDLVKALSCVRVPEYFFRYYLRKILKLLRKGFSYLQQDIDNIETEFQANKNFKGDLFQRSVWWRKVVELFGDIKGNNTTAANIEAQIEKYLKDLNDELRNDKLITSNNRKYVKNYSSWFDKFSSMEIINIEIPGQYTGFSCPNPHYHVKVFDFDKVIHIQHSIQLPIKIKFIGDDAKLYPYLIKCGEDIRQDQRIQQIFSIMNECSSSNKDSGLDKFLVTTYDVFPLTSYFGIIEWLEQTTPLRSFMDYHMSENEKKESERRREMLMKEYVQELTNYCPGAKELEYYEEAAKNYSENRTKLMFRGLCSRIPEDIFRKSLLVLCNSPGMYWHLREQFITTYSTLCIYGWVLGIGDRHLKNTLVCLKTGSCVGIDFGHAFGTGIECLPVPELIPFRMTPHIVSLMAPFYLTGLIRETMVSVLGVIHEKEYILLATMRIFILDPSFNWLNATKKLIQKQHENKDCYDVQWYPIKKIETVRRKLRGENPVKILVEEVNENRLISLNYSNACAGLLRGRNNLRSTLPDNMTLTEQVDCLLDLATDECILGTGWCGLETYI